MIRCPYHWPAVPSNDQLSLPLISSPWQWLAVPSTDQQSLEHWSAAPNNDQLSLWLIRQKIACKLSTLKRIKPVLKLENLTHIYRSIIEPYFTYCCIVWDTIGDTQMANLQKLQNSTVLIITGASYLKRSRNFLTELGWLNLEAMSKHQKIILMFKILNGLAPQYLSEMFTNCTSFHDYALQSSKKNLELPRNCTNFFAKIVLHLLESSSGMSYLIV